MTATHTITTVQPIGPSEPGALAGHQAVCSCGHKVSTSLSAREAEKEGWAHVDYMVRKSARVRNDGGNLVCEKS